MSKNDLQDSIRELRTAIGNLHVQDKTALRRVEGLIADLEHHTADPGDAAHRTILVESLPRLVEHFEVEHPQLSEILNRILVTLGGMGI